jgi:5'-nucleotidase (lipoprotein e(P4) family)
MKRLLKNYSKILTLSALISSTLLVVGFKSSEQILTQQQLNEQSLLAVIWLQQSGEYAALTHQSFNFARLAFDKAIAQGIENPAIIVDIDETILDNSLYQASLIDSNEQFNYESWSQWVLAQQATAIPGAIDFINYVQNQGGKVFFISDRSEKISETSDHNDLETATIANLTALGFQGVNEENVLLKGEFAQLVEGKLDFSKQFRRDAITSGKVDGIKYNIVLLIGDNLNDFDANAGITNPERRNYVEQHQQQYGITQNGEEQTIFPVYIILPNPIYGAWEAGLYNPQVYGKEKWYELSPSQKNQQRKATLKKWLQQ